ncbi:MAG: NAD(P)/FAD-dependent oxidoreductase [Sphingomonadaceae bacterium]
MRIAIVGSGISGLAAAWLLAKRHAVTLFEAEQRLGGHTHSVDVALGGLRYPVDTGFLVFNERTYPNLTALFAMLEIPIAKSDMSFSVSLEEPRVEWAGSNLDTLFAQRRNLLRPKFLGMLADILRFNREAARAANAKSQRPLGEFLERGRYGTAFRDWYLLPMAAAIWSCPTRTMLDYPFASFARFFRNHGLLELAGRPQWLTVVGGARRYVERMARDLPDVRLGSPVVRVRRDASGVRVGREHFDALVLACHSDQALAILGEGAASAERAVLGAISYQKNRAILHTDAALLPRQRRAWSAWNYSAGRDTPDGRPVAVHYLINRLQPLPFADPVIVSLNPHRTPDASRVLAEFDYEHPVFDSDACAAQGALESLQGAQRTWFCGAWTRYGFHEDGLGSALAVARAFGVEAPWRADSPLPAAEAEREAA